MSSFPDQQRAALTARAIARFGDTPCKHPQSFDALLGEDAVNLVTIKHWKGFRMDAPQERDMYAMLGGGYAQEIQRATAVQTWLVLDDDQVVVRLEKEVCLSFKQGPTVPADFFVLHRDGSVRFIWDDEIVQWTNEYAPKWCFCRFPIVPGVVVGASI